MKRIVITAMYLVILAGVGLGVRAVLGADSPAEPLAVMRRLGWLIGHQDSRHILSVPNPQEVSIGTATVLPEGVNLEIRGVGEIWMTWLPATGQAGHNDFPLQVHNMTSPPFENWTGPLDVASETVQIRAYVYPEVQHPFLIGGPDILAAPGH